MPQDAGAVPGELRSAGMPWLALALADPAEQSHAALGAGDAAVIDIAGPQAVPVTVNPFQPGPGCPVQAHADRLAGLFEASFGLAEPVAAAVRAGLRRVYAGCGWDAVTGAAAPGAVTSPAIPAFRQLRHAVAAAAEDLGYDAGVQASVRGFLHARLDALWTGPAGRFLEGGHPVDAGRLLRGHVLVANAGLGDDDALSFLAGVLLVRLAEQLRAAPAVTAGQGLNGQGPRPAVVIASPGGLAGAAARPAAAAWFGRLLDDIRSCGADVILAPLPLPPTPARVNEPEPATAHAKEAEPAPGCAREPAPAPGCAREPAPEPGPVPVFPQAEASGLIRGRRSAACGAQCRERPCRSYELHAAALLADEDRQAWLRLWVEALVLAFLTGRPVPRVPGPLRPGWRALGARRRECLLATVIDAAVTARARALRPSYDPNLLASVIGAVTTRMLDAASHEPPPGAGGLGTGTGTGTGGPFRAGAFWVIPQLRWLHEMERVTPLGHDRIWLDDIAPPLDFGLAGLPDWPGARIRDRVGGLRRHPLSPESGCNRELATTALLGDGGRAGLDADLATAGIGLSPLVRLREAARLMGAGPRGREPGWLEVVLSWPHRMIKSCWDTDVARPATG